MYSLTTDVTANNLDIRTKWHGLTASSSVFDVCVSHNVRISHNVTYHNNEQFAIHTSIMAENNLLNYDCGITLCVLTAWRCYCDSCTTICWNPACMAKGHHQHHTWRYHPIRLQSEIVILIFHSSFSFFYFFLNLKPRLPTPSPPTSINYNRVCQRNRICQCFKTVQNIFRGPLKRHNSLNTHNSRLNQYGVDKV